MPILTTQQKREILERGFTRRSLGRFAALLSAGATLPFYGEPALAQFSRLDKPIPPDAVKIDANENPLGPCPEAAEALHKLVQQGGRYFYNETNVFGRVLAEQEGLRADYVLPFAGSSDPLHRCVMAFASPGRGLVIGNPSYEAAERAASFIGAKVSKVPLTSSYAFDVKAMLQADPNPGVYYICSPNNPTGTVTPRRDIEYLLANKPAGSVLVLDEAYIHFSDEPFATDLVAKGKDIIVLRTFSKIYGMAGLRAGAAIARPDLHAKLMTYGMPPMPVLGMVGAKISLQSKTLVPERKKLMKEIREEQFAFLDKHNFKFIPSVSNKFLVDVKQPASRFMEAMRAENVYVGRSWPIWPTYSRITVGTREEMAKFQKAMLKVMG